MSQQKATFLTGGAGGEGESTGFEKSDVKNLERWKAHNDLINQVTFVPELQIVATCSFDCNVKMWRADTCFKCGSLKLGTGASQNAEATEAEKRANEKVW